MTTFRFQLRRGTAAEWATANPILSAGEPGVDLTTGDLRLGDGVSTWANLPSQLNKRAKGTTITPDDFPGTDHAKLQAAVNHCTANGYPTIILDRMLDLTGAGPVSVDKTPSWAVRSSLTFEGTGGGIVKHDAGVVFTSATEETGDLTFRGVKFVSTAGAGSVLIDADKLLRTFSINNEYRDWDLIARQVVSGRWAQSMRFLNEKIIGGAGPAFLFRESIDCTFDGILCEDRLTGSTGGLIANSDGAMTGIANRNLRIVNCCIENNSGTAVKLAMCYASILQGNYFEHNGQPDDPHIDLYTLATSSGQISVSLIGNEFAMQAAQLAARTPAVLLGQGRTHDLVISIGNVSDGGVLYKFGNASGQAIGTGDTIEAGGLLIYPGQEDRYITLPAGKSTTTAARPKNPRIGESYFDTTLGKPIFAKTAGTPASVELQFSAGASSSGNITITINGVSYVVAVTAGDTAAQVRDKVVAAADSVFWPTWRVAPYSTTTVGIDALTLGNVPGALIFAAGGTGVAQDTFAYSTNGTDPTWVDGAGVTV